jgi:lipoate-protein ligase A
MALDQTLLDLAERQGVGFLRIYRWSPFCLSFGRHEPALRRYNRSEIERRGLEVVRRPTGGRAVWHARELTYAVAAPIAWFGTLAQSYRAIHQTLADAVRSLGVTPTLADPTPTASLATGACFASPAGGEVLANDRKLIGSAQLRQGSAFLQHGSLLLEDNQDLVAEITIGQSPESHEITLTEAAGRSIPFEDAAEAVIGAFSRNHGGAHFEVPATHNARGRDDMPEIATNHLTRYSDPAWTWRR